MGLRSYRWTGIHVVTVLAAMAMACTTASPPGSDGSSPVARSAVSPQASVSPIDSRVPVVVGDPIDVASLTGRILFSSEDDVYSANADGTGLIRITHRDGPEFDAAWAPDGRRIVYRDSRRGINDDDEIFVANADGTGSRNLTKDPGNDWGPDWSPDGKTIVFNSDRDGLPMGGFLVNPDGSHLRRIPTDAYVEYPAWSPDGKRIAFMGGASAGEYDIWVVDIDGTNLVQLTDSMGSDGWPSWSPDGTRIAFTSVRDDCAYSKAPDCRTTGDIGPHHDVWVVNVDGTGLARVTPEFGQFMTWSPDGHYLLVSGFELYVIRPDGTGRTSFDIAGISGGLMPDWIASRT
jgi:Tol biopolymer transport system component